MSRAVICAGAVIAAGENHRGHDGSRLGGPRSSVSASFCPRSSSGGQFRGRVEERLVLAHKAAYLLRQVLEPRFGHRVFGSRRAGARSGLRQREREQERKN